MKKRWLSLLLALCMVLTLLPFGASAAEIVKSGTWGPDGTWELDSEGTLTISGNEGRTDLNYYPSEPEWCNNPNIRKVVIALNVCMLPLGNSEKAGGFKNDVNLKTVVLSATVDKIYTWMFEGCTSLEEFQVHPVSDYYCAIDGVLFSRDKTRMEVYPPAKKGVYQIPEGVTSLNFVGSQEITGFDTSLNSDFHVTDGILYDWTNSAIRCTTTKTGSVLLPEYQGGLKHCSIRSGAFENCKGITSVTLPVAADDIGLSTFKNCVNLEVVNGLDQITYIRNSAFENCKKLRLAICSEDATYIGERAFSGCESISTVLIPSQMTSVEAGAFSGCTKLAEVAILCKGNAIEERAFENCTSLKTVAINGSVDYIGKRAFAGCTSLTKFNMPDPEYTRWKPLAICPDAFSGCTALESVRVSNQIETVSGFTGCTSLKSVELPDSVTTLTDGAFSGCTSLREISIPGSVTQIGPDVFSGCTSLAKVTMNQGLETVFYNAFSGCTALQSVTFPSSIKKILTEAFKDCSGLTKVAFAAGVNMEQLDGGAFSGCSALKSFDIPNGLTEIPNRLFSGCDNMETVSIPVSMTSVKGTALCDARLLNIYVAADNPNFSAVDGVLYNKSRTSLVQYPTGRSGGFQVPDGVTSIGANAFCRAEGLSSITLPNGLKTIGADAFCYCTGLKKIDLPATVRNMYNEVFLGCTGLTSMTVPTGVKEIYPDLFCECDNLTSLTLPYTVRSMAKDCIDCNNLKDIYFEGSEEQWNQIDKHESIDWLIRNQGTKVHFLNKQPTPPTAPPASPAPVSPDELKGCHFQKFGNTRAEVARLLWELAGRPNVEGSASDLFTDTANVTPDQSKAIVWACRNGVSTGTSASTFTPDGEVTRAQFVTFLWRTQGEPFGGDWSPYPDVPAGKFYSEPACWQRDHASFAAFGLAEGGKFMPDEKIGDCFALRWKDGEQKTVHVGYGHEYDTGAVTKAATETAEGVKTFTCVHCGATKTEAIPKLTPKPTTSPAPSAQPTTSPAPSAQPTTSPAPSAQPTTSPAPSAKPTAKPDAENPFKDVSKDQYYYEPVLWAVNHDPQITAGTAKDAFSPNNPCTRGQIVTFLWRANGQPEPTIKTNPFTDVKASDYFYKAVLWAVEKEITAGTSKTTFSPNDTVTRAQTVTFLWRAEGKPAAETKNPFTDVPAGQYYTDAVLWAVKNNITAGTSATTFSPANPCTRAQIVTFLYRDLAK